MEQIIAAALALSAGQEHTADMVVDDVSRLRRALGAVGGFRVTYTDGAVTIRRKTSSEDTQRIYRRIARAVREMEDEETATVFARVREILTEEGV